MKLVHLFLPLKSNRVSRLDGGSREIESEPSTFRFQNFRIEPSLSSRGLASKIDCFTIRNHCFVASRMKLIFPFIAKVNNTYQITGSRRITYITHPKSAGTNRPQYINAACLSCGSHLILTLRKKSSSVRGIAGEGTIKSMLLRGFSLVVESWRLYDSSSPFWKACRVWKQHKHNFSCNKTPCL